MKNFLAKQKKGKGKPAAAEPKPEAATTATEEAKDQPPKDAEVIQKKEQAVAPKTSKADKNQDSSEEEEEINYGNIDEIKQTAKKTNNEPNIFEQETKKEDPKAAPKKATGEIKFGGPPRKFTRGPKGGIGGDFKKGLDDLDDGDDADDKKGGKGDSQPAEETSGAAGGQGAWEGFRSQARAPGGNKDQNEEEKQESRPAAVKPTFRGKANLKGTGTFADTEDRGTNRTYDFAVAFRSQGDEKREKNEEGKENRGDTAQRGGRNRRGRGGRGGFGPSQAQQDEDEGFEVVRDGRKKKTRQNNDSDSDEAPATGGGRGGRGRGGRGGFFTNSSRTKE